MRIPDDIHRQIVHERDALVALAPQYTALVDGVIAECRALFGGKEYTFEEIVRDVCSRFKTLDSMKGVDVVVTDLLRRSRIRLLVILSKKSRGVVVTEPDVANAMHLRATAGGLEKNIYPLSVAEILAVAKKNFDIFKIHSFPFAKAPSRAAFVKKVKKTIEDALIELLEKEFIPSDCTEKALISICKKIHVRCLEAIDGLYPVSRAKAKTQIRLAGKNRAVISANSSGQDTAFQKNLLDKVREDTAKSIPYISRKILRLALIVPEQREGVGFSKDKKENENGLAASDEKVLGKPSPEENPKDVRRFSYAEIRSLVESHIPEDVFDQYLILSPAKIFGQVWKLPAKKKIVRKKLRERVVQILNRRLSPNADRENACDTRESLVALCAGIKDEILQCVIELAREISVREDKVRDATTERLSHFEAAVLDLGNGEDSESSPETESELDEAEDEEKFRFKWSDEELFANKKLPQTMELTHSREEIDVLWQEAEKAFIKGFGDWEEECRTKIAPGRFNDSSGRSMTLDEALKLMRKDFVLHLPDIKKLAIDNFDQSLWEETSTLESGIATNLNSFCKIQKGPIANFALPVLQHFFQQAKEAVALEYPLVDKALVGQGPRWLVMRSHVTAVSYMRDVTIKNVTRAASIDDLGKAIIERISHVRGEKLKGNLATIFHELSALFVKAIERELASLPEKQVTRSRVEYIQFWKIILEKSLQAIARMPYTSLSHQMLLEAKNAASFAVCRGCREDALRIPLRYKWEQESDPQDVQRELEDFYPDLSEELETEKAYPVSTALAPYSLAVPEAEKHTPEEFWAGRARAIATHFFHQFILQCTQAGVEIPSDEILEEILDKASQSMRAFADRLAECLTEACRAHVPMPSRRILADAVTKAAKECEKQMEGIPLSIGSLFDPSCATDALECPRSYFPDIAGVGDQVDALRTVLLPFVLPVERQVAKLETDIRELRARSEEAAQQLRDQQELLADEEPFLRELPLAGAVCVSEVSSFLVVFQREHVALQKSLRTAEENVAKANAALAGHVKKGNNGKMAADLAQTLADRQGERDVLAKNAEELPFADWIREATSLVEDLKRAVGTLLPGVSLAARADEQQSPSPDSTDLKKSWLEVRARASHCLTRCTDIVDFRADEKHFQDSYAADAASLKEKEEQLTVARDRVEVREQERKRATLQGKGAASTEKVTDKDITPRAIPVAASPVLSPEFIARNEEMGRRVAEVEAMAKDWIRQARTLMRDTHDTCAELLNGEIASDEGGLPAAEAVQKQRLEMFRIFMASMKGLDSMKLLSPFPSDHGHLDS